MAVIHALARTEIFLAFGALWILQIINWNQWWGPTGLYLGIGAIPIGLTLPFVYLVKTGFFHTFSSDCWRPSYSA